MMLFQKKYCDYIVVGLGNPGESYAHTRHNTGFRVLDVLEKTLDIRINRSKFRSLTELAVIDGQKVLFLKPQTFMNASGLALLEASASYHVPPERIIVLFDDICLPVGKIRIRRDGSAGGHNGIKSVISCLHSDAFPRIKIGIGAKPHANYDLADYVLSRFSAGEELLLKPALERAAEATLFLVQHGAAEAANRYNGQ